HAPFRETSDRLHQALFCQPIVQLIKNHRQDDDRANDDLTIVLVNAQDDDAAADHLNNQRAQQRSKGRALGALLGALVIQMISSGIVILGIDQNYSQIIIGAVVILAVVFDQLNNWLAKQRLVKAI